MIPLIIHQTARSRQLSPEETRLAKRAKEVLYGWEYLLWDDEQNHLLFRQFFPQHLRAYNAISLGVAKADLARCLYMYAYGGFYIDTDYRMEKPFGQDILCKDCIIPLSRQNGTGGEYRLGNAVLASKPGVLFWYDFINSVFEDSRLNTLKENMVEDVTGPKALTRFYLNKRLSFPEIYTPPRHQFHPRITAAGFGVEGRGHYGVHLCWGSWRSKNKFLNFKNKIVRILTSI